LKTLNSPISVITHCDLAVASYTPVATICDVSGECFPGRTNHVIPELIH